MGKKVQSGARGMVQGRLVQNVHTSTCNIASRFGPAQLKTMSGCLANDPYIATSAPKYSLSREEDVRKMYLWISWWVEMDLRLMFH